MNAYMRSLDAFPGRKERSFAGCASKRWLMILATIRKTELYKLEIDMANGLGRPRHQSKAYTCSCPCRVVPNMCFMPCRAKFFSLRPVLAHVLCPLVQCCKSSHVVPKKKSLISFFHFLKIF